MNYTAETLTLILLNLNHNRIKWGPYKPRIGHTSYSMKHATTILAAPAVLSRGSMSK